MIVPEKFKHENVVHGDARFECIEEAAHGAHAKDGLLHAGRLVWTEEPIKDNDPPGNVIGFVDNVGIVRTDSRNLRPVRG